VIAITIAGLSTRANSLERCLTCFYLSRAFNTQFARLIHYCEFYKHRFVFVIFQNREISFHLFSLFSLQLIISTILLIINKKIIITGIIAMYSVTSYCKVTPRLNCRFFNYEFKTPKMLHQKLHLILNIYLFYYLMNSLQSQKSTWKYIDNESSAADSSPLRHARCEICMTLPKVRERDPD